MDIRSIPVEVNSFLNRLGKFIFHLNIYLAKHFFNGITVISPSMKRYIAEKYSIDKEKIGIWSSGVNTEHFDPARFDEHRIKEQKQKLSLYDKFVIMYHGVLTSSRGLQETIAAISLLKDSHKDIIFLVLGDGVAKPILQRLIRDYQVNGNVRLMGVIPYNEIPYYLSICDVGILPFPDLIWWRVSSPLKLMEYLAMEKPVIATDIEAHRDIIDSSRCAFSIPDNSPAEIESSILSAYDQRHSLCVYGKLGRKIVVQEYTWDNQTLNLINFLCSLN
jgi:glycosyltransferase involved in cell wall biosynthesis